jgi:hypothetical protein
MPKTLTPADPPILLAGLIAARRTGDKLLAEVFMRELERLGILVRFRDRPIAGAHRQEGRDAD